MRLRGLVGHSPQFWLSIGLVLGWSITSIAGFSDDEFPLIAIYILGLAIYLKIDAEKGERG